MRVGEKVPIDAKNKLGQTALMIASQQGEDDSVSATPAYHFDTRGPAPHEARKTYSHTPP